MVPSFRRCYFFKLKHCWPKLQTAAFHQVANKGMCATASSSHGAAATGVGPGEALLVGWDTRATPEPAHAQRSTSLCHTSTPCLLDACSKQTATAENATAVAEKWPLHNSSVLHCSLQVRCRTGCRPGTRGCISGIGACTTYGLPYAGLLRRRRNSSPARVRCATIGNV